MTPRGGIYGDLHGDGQVVGKYEDQHWRRSMKIYLAGPMRGLPNFNFAAFNEAAKVLRDQGYTVFSPAEKGEEAVLQNDPGLQENISFRRKVFKLDLSWICDHAEAVALLPGWEKSLGAKAERAAAEAIGLTIIILGSDYHA